MTGKNVVIIGAGNIGQTLAKIIRKNSKSVKLWDKDQSKNPKQKPLLKIIPEADFVFFCFPSSSFRVTVKTIAPFLKKQAVIISLAKGVTENALETVDAVLKKNLRANQKISLLAGPFLAGEIRQGLPAFGVIASQQKVTFEKIKKLFAHSSIHLEFSSDLKGVALSSSLKNVYALLLGAVDGLKFGMNTKGYLATRAAEEMEEIVKTLGGKHETAMGPAGLGDLITTGFSLYSKNRQLGETLAKKNRIITKSEGYRSVDCFIKILTKKSKKFPLLLGLDKIIKNPKQTGSIIREFLK